MYEEHQKIKAGKWLTVGSDEAAADQFIAAANAFRMQKLGKMDRKPEEAISLHLRASKFRLILTSTKARRLAKHLRKQHKCKSRTSTSPMMKQTH